MSREMCKCLEMPLLLSCEMPLLLYKAGAWPLRSAKALAAPSGPFIPLVGSDELATQGPRWDKEEEGFLQQPLCVLRDRGRRSNEGGLQPGRCVRSGGTFALGATLVWQGPPVTFSGAFLPRATTSTHQEGFDT